ncbi:MAG: zinc ribbon domain-containing protein [Paracoccaceae bacterium]
MVRDPDTGRRVNRDNPQDRHQEVAAEHLRIVPADLFAQAEARRVDQSTAAARGEITKAPPRPFSGLLRCASCGGGMVIHDRAGDAIRIRCSTATQSGSCTNTARFRLDRIEAAILDRLREQMDRPEYLREFVRVYAAERRRLADAARKDKAQIERRVTDVAAKYRRLVDMMARGLIEGPEAEAQVIEAKRAAADAAADLAQATADPTVIELHPRAADEYGRAIRDLAQAVSDGSAKFDRGSVDALRRVVTRIVVHPKGENGYALVDVIGHMDQLLNLDAPIVGGAVVARGGLEPPTLRL